MVRVVRHRLTLDCILLLLVGTTEMNKNKGVTLNLSSGASIEFLDRKNVELTEELALAHETGTHWAELAEQRQKRIHELAAQANKFKDEAEALRKENARLTRGLRMIINQGGIAGTVASRVVRNDGSYK